MTFYERTKELLERRNMTFADLSRIIHISQPSMNGWKNGSTPRADVAYNIAKLLNTTVEYLIAGEEELIPHDVLDFAYETMALPPMFKQFMFDQLEMYKRRQSEQERVKTSNAG